MLLAEGRVLRALFALPLFASPASTLASGFAVESQGARAAGFAGASVAQSADASAILANAAGIGFLRKPSLYLAAGFTTVSTDFTGEGPAPPSGTLARARGGASLLPSVYYSRPLSERAALGIGAYAPFAFRSEWESPDQFAGRYLCTDCRVSAWSVNPTVAYRLEDRLSVGLGLDLRLSSFRNARRLVASPNPFPVATDVAEMTFDSGTAVGVGWNAGVLASPSEDVSVGLAYRHKVRIDHRAQASFAQLLTGDSTVDQAVAATLPSTEAAVASFTYPASLAGGVAVKRGDWTIEGDLAWTFWSSFDAVTLAFPGRPAFDTALPQDFGNGWRAAIGAEYRLADAWEVRGGYSYDRSPQPQATLSPLLHDLDRHALCVGGSYSHERLRLDASARLPLYRGRSTGGLSRYGYDGVYQANGFSLAVSLGYRF